VSTHAPAIDTALAVLTELVASTEAAWADCVRGDAGPAQIAAFVHERQRCLQRLDGATAPSASARELADRLRALDQRLLAWCDERRRELVAALASLPRRSSDAPVSAERMLSDVA